MTDIVARMKALHDLTNEDAWAVVTEGAKEIECLRETAKDARMLATAVIDAKVGCLATDEMHAIAARIIAVGVETMAKTCPHGNVIDPPASDCLYCISTQASFGAGDVNDILRVVQSMSANGDVQLSILSRALVVGCKSCRVDKARALEVISQLFDEAMHLVPLNTTTQ